MTIANLETGVAERRSRLRSDITLAARAVPTHYPLRRSSRSTLHGF